MFDNGQKAILLFGLNHEQRPNLGFGLNREQRSDLSCPNIVEVLRNVKV